MIARVSLEIALRKEFDYAIPPELEGRVDVGSRVQVPFGPRKVLGVVTAAATRPGLHARAVAIRAGGKASLFIPDVQRSALSGPGALTELAWSPDARWLLASWPSAVSPGGDSGVITPNTIGSWACASGRPKSNAESIAPPTNARRCMLLLPWLVCTSVDGFWPHTPQSVERARPPKTWCRF